MKFTTSQNTIIKKNFKAYIYRLYAVTESIKNIFRYRLHIDFQIRVPGKGSLYNVRFN